MRRRRERSIERRRRTAIPWLVLAASLVVTALTTGFAEWATRTSELLRFRNSVQSTHEEIRDRLSTYINVLRAGAGLFAGSDEVTRDDFRAFVSKLELQRRYPGIQGIGYSARLTAAEREELTERMRNEIPGFEVWPEPGREIFHTILYLEPLDRRNRAAIGFDMSSNEVRRAAMNRARDTGLPAMSGKVTLVQEIDERKQAGFLIYVPVYETPSTPQTVEERRRLLRGFVYSPFRADDLLHGIFGAASSPEIGFEVYDGGEVASGNLLHRSSDNAAHPSRYTTAMKMTVGGRAWTLRFHTEPEFDAASARAPVYFIGFGGLLFSFALFFVTRRETSASEEAERAAASLARNEATLREEKQKLETLNRVGRAIAGELERRRLVQQVTDAATELSGATFGAFLDVRDGTEGLDLVALSPSSRQELPAAVRAIAEQAVRDGEVVRIEDVATDRRFARPDDAENGGEAASGSILAVPVVSRSGGSVGAVVAVHPSSGAFSESDEVIVMALAAHTATAIDNANLFAEVLRERATAEEANRAKDDFLATLSHELRTPMTSILGWASLLQHDGIDETTARTAIDAIVSSSGLQARLIDDLLDLSRITTGKMEIQPTAVDVREVIRGATAAIERAAEERHIAFNLVLTSGPQLVWGDARRLQQVFWNILSNAVKFSRNGGRIRVSMRAEERAVSVTVEDDGEGIDPAFLPHLFDRFTQGDSTATRAHGGLGIGLSIVRHLVELHGGSIEPKSEGIGKGAAFIVTLPRLEERQIAALRREHVRRVEEPAQSLAGLRLLIVEDESGVREFITAVLSRAGASTVGVGSARAAISHLVSSDVDCIVSDIAMPEEDGCSMIRRVRALPEEGKRRTPALALTALARGDDRAKILAAGFDEHLHKPVEAAILVAAVARVARQRSGKPEGIV